MFTKLKEHIYQDQKLSLQYDTVTAVVEVLSDSVVHIYTETDEKTPVSQAVEEVKKEFVPVKFEKNDGFFLLRSNSMIIKISETFQIDYFDALNNPISLEYTGKRVTKKGLSESDQVLMALEGHKTDAKEDLNYPIQVVRVLEEKDAVYGLGDKTGVLNKRGYEYEMWNTDDPSPHEDSFKSLYKSIPFMIVKKPHLCYGIFFDNHNRTYFDLGKESEQYYYFAAKEGNLDYYFFSGKQLSDVVKDYTWLTGTLPLPQLWSLGYHQSRWGYESEKEIRSIAENMRHYEIPCDCIHFDIDYMDHYKVFTWNKETHKDPNLLIDDLKKDGFQVVTIIDPGVKVEKKYYVYEEGKKNHYFATTPKNKIYENEVWPGTSVFPDFGKKEVRSWWGQLHSFLLNKGVSGIWNDMNEPASFRGPLPDDVVFHDEEFRSNHSNMHNVYGHLMAKATYEGVKNLTGKRPFVITRACYSGSQKYSLCWTGDNCSLWTHLRMSIPQLLNMGLSGLPFSGCDIGGFNADCTPELMIRWIESGCFSPFFRNHSAKGTKDQEPWMFNEKVLSIYKRYVELRYELIPYYYDLFHECEYTGAPVMRPLVYHYPDDPATFNMNDQFMIGEYILVSPVVEQGATMKLVYLPEGTWYDYWSKEKIIGGRYLMRKAPLAVCPVYIKAGAILPKFPVRQNLSSYPYPEITFEVYPGEGSYTHYLDNGEDFSYRNGVLTKYLFKQDENGRITTEILQNGFKEYDMIHFEKIIPYYPQ